MSIFDNMSLKNLYFQYTSTHERYILHYVKENLYLNIISIHNDTTYEHLSSTTYGSYVPSIDNEW